MAIWDGGWKLFRFLDVGVDSEDAANSAGVTTYVGEGHAGDNNSDTVCPLIDE